MFANALGRMGPLRSLFVVLAVLLTAIAPAGAHSAHEATPAAASAPSDAACAQGTPADWTAQMDAYTAAGAYPAVQTQDGNAISSVMVEVPKIDFSGPGLSSTLPVGPCQTIYRFQYSDISAPDGAAMPFQYVEIDWNTEGEPRGPNGTFISPHFDFHFYLQSKSAVDQMMQCVSTNGKTCDQFETSYDQMRLFQDMPLSPYVPANYRPDVGSAIPEMGLHLLDATFDYTVDNVNHTPTLIYGTFNGQVVFAEASVTLFTLQDVVAAPDHQITYAFEQPQQFANNISWPTNFQIIYNPDTGGFQAGFIDFNEHKGS